MRRGQDYIRPVTEQKARTKCDIETRSTDIEISNGNSDICVESWTHMNDKPAPLRHNARTRGILSRYRILAGCGGFSNAPLWQSDIWMSSLCCHRLVGSVFMMNEIEQIVPATNGDCYVHTSPR